MKLIESLKKIWRAILEDIRAEQAFQAEFDRAERKWRSADHKCPCCGKSKTRNSHDT